MAKHHPNCFMVIRPDHPRATCTCEEVCKKTEDCPSRDDGVHCNHWWDGGVCCSCKAPAMSEEQEIAQGMRD